MHDYNKNELRPTISTRQLPKAVPQSRKIIYQRQYNPIYVGASETKP